MSNREEVIEYAKLGFAFGIAGAAMGAIASKGNLDKSLSSGLMFAGMSAIFITIGFFEPKSDYVYKFDPEPNAVCTKEEYINERTEESN